MSVRENLEMGCYLRSDKAQIAADLEGLLARFPILARAGRAGGRDACRAASSRCWQFRAR